MVIHKANLRYGLEELSSRELQEERWLGLVPGVQSSFEEASCWVYDHSNIDIAIFDYEFIAEYGVEVVDSINILHTLLGKVDSVNMGVQEIIDSVIMDEIRAVSGGLLTSKLFLKDG